MIINNREYNRTTLVVNLDEALELIEELSKAVKGAMAYGHRTTSGMAAVEVLQDASQKPSSFNITVEAK